MARAGGVGEEAAGAGTEVKEARARIATLVAENAKLKVRGCAAFRDCVDYFFFAKLKFFLFLFSPNSRFVGVPCSETVLCVGWGQGSIGVQEFGGEEKREE